MKTLDWPIENAHLAPVAKQSWSHAGSNICLDFHGDPVNAKLVVYSDGNHHMALQQSVQEFLVKYPDAQDIFYATTPPGVLVNALQNNGLLLGNLTLSVQPNIFIGPEFILDKLIELQYCEYYTRFIKSQGNVALVLKGNPLNIKTTSDLINDDVCLFLSNPETEKASYQVYFEFLLNSGLTDDDIENIKIHYGQKIHHREAPQALYSGEANVAIVYYHLALRYCRIFPDVFDIVELLPLNSDINPVTEYAITILNNAGLFGQSFSQFMLSEQVSSIYQQHGLQKL